MAVGMSVQMLGLPQFLSELQRLEQKTRARVEKESNASTIEALQVAKQLSAVKTGYFKSRWQVRAAAGTPNVIWWELYNDASYAAPLIFGHHTRSGSWVAPRDCLTPAVLYGRKRMNQRLNGLLGSMARWGNA
jgi:hypothetical protein